MSGVLEATLGAGSASIDFTTVIPSMDCKGNVQSRTACPQVKTLTQEDLRLTQLELQNKYCAGCALLCAARVKVWQSLSHT